MLFDLDNKIDNMVFQKESPYCYSLSYDDYTYANVIVYEALEETLSIFNDYLENTSSGYNMLKFDKAQNKVYT